MKSCPARDPRRCYCGFSMTVVEVIFLSLLESAYTVLEERDLRRALYLLIQERSIPDEEDEQGRQP